MYSSLPTSEQSVFSIRPHDHKLRIYLSQNFKLVLLLHYLVLLMKQNFKDLCKSAFCSHLQIIKSVCPVKFDLILDLRIFSVYGHGARTYKGLSGVQGFHLDKSREFGGLLLVCDYHSLRFDIRCIHIFLF